MDTGHDFHMAKDIAFAHGTTVDVLAVGGLFGILEVLIRQVSEGYGLPWDLIAMGALGALSPPGLGYELVGSVRGDGLPDMTPFEQGEKREEDDRRFAVEPWLPHQYTRGAFLWDLQSAIVFGTLLIAVPYFGGVFGTTAWVPVP